MSSIENVDDAEEELRTQLQNVFPGAMFPVDDPFELIPLLPDGKDTVFDVGTVSIPAKDLGMKYNDHQEYPYDDPESLIDDIIRSVKEHDDLYREDKEYEHSLTIDLDEC